MRRRKFAFLSPKKSLLTFPQIAHTPNLSLSGLAWTPAPLPHPDDLLVQKWPGPTAGALSSPPFLPCPCPACTALPAARTGGGTLHPPLQRGGKHQIKTASPSSIGVKGSPSLQNSPQLLHKLHPTHFHTSSCRDVPGGLQTWMLYFSAPYFPEKKSILGAPCLWDQWSPKPDRDVTHQAGVVDTAMDVAHQATRSSFLQHLPSLRYLLCPWKSSAGCRDGKGLTQS